MDLVSALGHECNRTETYKVVWCLAACSACEKRGEMSPGPGAPVRSVVSWVRGGAARGTLALSIQICSLMLLAILLEDLFLSE